MDKDTFIRDSLNHLFVLWVQRSMLWGCALFIMLGGLDYLVTPENAPHFFVYRLIISLFLLASSFLVRRVSWPYPYVIGFLTIAATAAAIELMILQFGGHESPYYVGMILVGVAIIGFIPARFSIHVGTALTIYLIYLLPIIMTASVAGHRDFLISNAFIILIFITMLVTRYMSGKALVRDLGLRYDLDRYQKNLEHAVAERTAELAGAIEDLRREIAERKLAEADRERLQGQLLQVQKMESVGRLAGGVAHDFNNILTAILSYAELCLMKLPGDHPVRGYASAIRDASEKAASLTHQLLAFSRKQVLEMRSVDLNAVVEGMARMLRRIIGEDVVLEIRTDEALRPILADKGQLEQVLMNLAVNARDAMPQGGSLIIGTEPVRRGDLPAGREGALRDQEYVLLTVKDTGKGMSTDVRDRIFEPFFTTKELGKGTGLGLSMVYGIVKQHDGHIAVDSDAGRGTTFRIYLPVAAAHAAQRYEGALAMPQGTETVLIVEDDQAIRSLVREILEPLGYRVLVTASGEEALACLRSDAGPVHLLLTDVIMPGMNGKTLAEEVLALRPGIRVLFMSGYPYDALSDQGLLGSGASLVHKPLSPAILAAHVRRMLDNES